MAIHVAGSPTPPRYVSAEEIPESERDERRVHEAKAKEEGKPDNVVDRIVEGQLAKWAKQVALPRPGAHSHGSLRGQDIEEIRAEIAANTGENIASRASQRFGSARRSARAPSGRNRDAANVLRTQCAGTHGLEAVAVAAVMFTVAAGSVRAPPSRAGAAVAAKDDLVVGVIPQRPLERGRGSWDAQGRHRSTRVVISWAEVEANRGEYDWSLT